jgi:hypothetical protein
MRTIGTLALALLVLCAASVPSFAQDRGKGLGKAGGELSEREHARLALFVIEKIDAGVTGDALEAALRAKLEEIHKERKEGKKDGDKDGKPGEGANRGLEDKDLANLGRFVNEQLAAGLRGTKLSDAIHGELKKIKENRAKDNGKGDQGNKPENPGKGAKGKGK